MKIELNVSKFRDLFFHNSDYNNKYSYDALGLIYDWYEENDPDYDFDMGEIVSRWADYDDFASLESDFHYLVDQDEYDELEDEDEKIEYLIKVIERSHAVTKYNNGSSFLIME